MTSEPTNLDRYKKDLDSLVIKGQQLLNAIQFECHADQFRSEVERLAGSKAKAEAIIKALPSFVEEYQAWFSEARVLIRQLLPDRLADFVRLYEKPKSRKEISFESYRIEDYLQGLRRIQPYTREVIVDGSAAIPHFRQQLAILKAVGQRFESSLFEIRQLVQADLFDSELDAAEELLRNGYLRSAGALAGVILEKHLAQVCENHQVNLSRKTASIGNLNNALKDAGVIDTPDWRLIQHLGDIRNLCDHRKSDDPTKEQVESLIQGVTKLTRTLF